jgi:hypothetical protein
MKLLGLAVPAAAVALLGGVPALAQEPGTEVGGYVMSMLELSIDDATSLPAFKPGPASHEATVDVRVTSTEPGAQLFIADGDAASGRRLGHLSRGGRVLDQPLQVGLGTGPFQSLDTPFDPLLAAFGGPVANRKATLRLRQRIGRRERPRGTYGKTVLITLSSSAP